MYKEKLLSLLGLAATATDTEIETAVAAANAALDALKPGEEGAARPTVAAAAQAAAIAAREAASYKGALAAATASAANERTGRSADAVTAAIRRGAITAAERTAWEQRLATAPDYAAAANSLDAIPDQQAVKTTTAIPNAKDRDDAVHATADAKARFTAAVHKHMAETKSDYETSWSAVSKTEEGKALLQKMETK